jgi:GH35 family endo-1,4-beta-xylanase
MIRFITHSTNLIANDLVNAHLIARDNEVIQGEIFYEDGVIMAQSSGHTSFAFCLQCDVGKAGRLILQTSVLPARAEPYILDLELARHRIKLFLDLSENWGLFRLDDDNHAVKRWEESRLIFTKALVAEDIEEICVLSKESLRIAIDASERLTMEHANLLLHHRFLTKAASPSTLGVRVSADRFDEPLRELLDKNIDIVSIPMRWSLIEPEKGKYKWGEIDRWVQWARDHKKTIIAGPLLNFDIEDGIPPWVKEHEHEYPHFRDKCYDHVEQVVHRYGAAISFWNVVGGINTNRWTSLSVANMVDLIRTSSLIVRHSRKGAQVMIELTNLFNEFVAGHSRGCSGRVFLSRLSQEGIRLDALGVQCFVGGDNGRSSVDLMRLSSKLDEFLHIDFPLIISAFGTPSETISEEYGWWKSKWSESQQEQWAGQMLAIALSKPFVDSVIWADLYDHDNMDVPSSAFISTSGQPRPVLNRLLTIRNRLRKPLGSPDRTQTTSSGEEIA